MAGIHQERKERMFGKTPARPPTPPKPTDDEQDDGQEALVNVLCLAEDVRIVHTGLMPRADAAKLVEEWKAADDEQVIEFKYRHVDSHPLSSNISPHLTLAYARAGHIVEIRYYV